MIQSILSLIVIACLGLFASQGRASSPADVAFFEQKVRPLLIERCHACHSVASDKKKGGLLLDSRAAILLGGDSGPAAVAGDPSKSLMVQALHYTNTDLQMPPKGKLAQREIETLTEWVRRGLYYPESAGTAKRERRIDIVAGKQFWSFQPVREAAVPQVKHNDWPIRRIDHFTLAAMESRNLLPTGPAAKATLIRRAKFDLLGLPPTPEEVDRFVLNNRPNAYAELIEGWLKSPHYGERWGRYWLDLARYCDIGEVWMETKGLPYRYRDWVVRALNEDMPYQQFVRLQLAADQMNGARPEDRAALGFIGLSPTYWKELQLPVEIIKTIVSDEYEERIHTLSSTFLGLNMACARCHDHKNDPITVEDYYALLGVFASTRQADQALSAGVNGLAVATAWEEVGKLEAEIKKLSADKAAASAAKMEEVKRKVAQLKKTPGYNAPLVPGAVDATLTVVAAKGTHGSQVLYQDKPQDMPIEIRGNPNKPGALVPRRFVSVLSAGEPRRFEHGSGRVDLANAMVDQAGPLMARVMVNRVWKSHFGTGLVETTSDFGSQGERPSHPELLEDLAARFMSNGWSLKWLHREIMLSATYQQASGTPPAGDESLRYYTRFGRRRLDIEAWRDALLMAGGTFDATVGGPPQELNLESNRRRTIYGTVKRRELTDLLRLHDFPDPVTHSPSRQPTITPLQQLFILNSPLLTQQSGLLAQRLKREAGAAPAARIDLAYRLLFGRIPTPEERNTGLDFVGGNQDSTWRDYAHVLLASNEFQFID